jgi:hypothetical protein
MIRKIAAVVGGAALATSLIAAGVGATFTATAAGADTINVGHMTISAGAQMTVPTWANAVNPGCTITVADINSQGSTGSKLCYVWVQDGNSNIIPSALNVTVATSGTLTEPSLWTVTDGTSSGPLSAALVWNYATNNASFNQVPAPFYKTFTVSWNSLTSASYSDSFVITFNVTATA